MELATIGTLVGLAYVLVPPFRAWANRTFDAVFGTGRPGS